MNTELINWAKTVLFAYKYLGAMCRSIDKRIKKMAVNSFYIGGVWNEENSVYKISERMIKLSDKKVDYINLKLMIEKCLQEMKQENAKLLILRNINGDNPHFHMNLSQSVAGLLNISERTYFRKLNFALKEFARIMERHGYSYQKLEICFWNDDFIKSIYNIIVNNQVTSLSGIEFERELIAEPLLRLCDC